MIQNICMKIKEAKVPQPGETKGDTSMTKNTEKGEVNRDQVLQHKWRTITWKWNQVKVKQQIDNTRLVEVFSKDVVDNRFMWIQGGTIKHWAERFTTGLEKSFHMCRKLLELKLLSS